MNKSVKENTCCFFDHRTINETEELRRKLTEIIEDMIINKNVNIFLFGSKSRFDSLCLEIVTAVKEKYSHIKRIYVRAEFPDISDEYKAYLFECYDETYYPEKITGAGKAVYIERNYEMIDKSKYCVVYCDEENLPAKRKSGTKIALHYAIKKENEILLLK